jgi:hypothetical protein
MYPAGTGAPVMPRVGRVARSEQALSARGDVRLAMVPQDAAIKKVRDNGGRFWWRLSSMSRVPHSQG